MADTFDGDDKVGNIDNSFHLTGNDPSEILSDLYSKKQEIENDLVFKSLCGYVEYYNRYYSIDSDSEMAKRLETLIDKLKCKPIILEYIEVLRAINRFYDLFTYVKDGEEYEVCDMSSRCFMLVKYK